MSFLNHMGLGFLDPENNLDKLANSIKGGDVRQAGRNAEVHFRRPGRTPGELY